MTELNTGVGSGSLTLSQLTLTVDPNLRSEKPDYYLNFYDEILAPRRYDSLNILELGVFRGGSILLFAKYFPQARILGVDIQEPPKDFYDAAVSAGVSDRIRVAIASQADEKGLVGAIESCFGQEQLDLVIDDASHCYRETRSAFDVVFGSRLRPGGTYIIEDWGCGYWPGWPDGHPDGQHGLPRLVKELVDLLALADRTKLWGGQRALPADTELPSPISRVVLLQSIAALTRSDAPMPSGPLLSIDEADETVLAEPLAEQVEETELPLGFRALLGLLPGAARRAVARRWTVPSDLLRRRIRR